MSQQFYYHTPILPTSLLHNLSSLNNTYLTSTQTNHLHLYNYTAQGLSLHKTYSFPTHIAHTITIPNKHQNNDYLFLVDRRGKYAFWSVMMGMEGGDNNVEIGEQHQLFGQGNQEQCQFVSEQHWFDVLDTKGCICYNIKHQLVIIQYTIKSTGLKPQKPRLINIDLLKYRQLICLNTTKQRQLLGVIHQQQQKTFLKIYPLDKRTQLTPQNYQECLQLSNIIECISVDNGKILMLTHNQMVLANLTPLECEYRFKIQHRKGKICKISSQMYGYIGEEIVLVHQDKMKSYGSFTLNGANMLQKQGVEEVTCLRQLQDGGYLLSILTSYHQLYLITLYQHTWSLSARLDSLSPIFSLHPTMNPHCWLAVTMSAHNQYSLCSVERLVRTRVVKEEEYEGVVEKMVVMEGGRRVVMAGKEGARMLWFNQASAGYEAISNTQTLPGDMLAANEHLYITPSAVYTFNEHSSLTLHFQAQISLCCLSDHTVFYMDTTQHKVHTYNNLQNSHQILRQGDPSQYLWLILSSGMLVAKSSHIGQLMYYQGAALVKGIELIHKELVHSLVKIGQNCVAVGFIDGYVQVLGPTYTTVACFQGYCNQMVSFFQLSNGVGVLSGSHQLILTHNNQQYQLQPIQLSHHTSLQTAAYLPHLNTILTIHPLKTTTLMTYLTLPSDLPHHTPLLNQITHFPQIPIITIYKQYAFIAVKQQLIIYSLANRVIIKYLSHYCNDVIGIQIMGQTLVLYGIDKINRNLLIFVNPNTLTITHTINLILKDHKYIKNIKIINNNTFICRTQKYTIIYQISDNNEPIELNQIKTQYQGYSLEIDKENQVFGQTDSYRFIALYKYQQGIGIAPMNRYVAQAEVNDFVVMDKASVYGDKKGYLNVLEYNVENSQATLKMINTKVANINLHSEITTLVKNTSKETIYGTFDGQIGKINIISQPIFRKLKNIEQSVLNKINKKQTFQYQKWRDRNVENDKMIDGSLIKMYLENHESRNREMTQEGSDYQQILKLYRQLGI